MKKTVFRYDLSLLFILIVTLLPFVICGLTFPESRKVNIALSWIMTILIISILFSVVSSVKISNEEITVTNWSGRQTLRWDEITNASFHFSELRLYNSVDNKMLVVDLGVHGYETILETIMQRRSDLFSENTDFVISHKVFTPPYWGSVVTLIFILLSVYRESNSWISILIYYAVCQLIFFLFSLPEIKVSGNTIHLKYALKTISYKANEVASISSERGYTRLGRAYDIAKFHLKNGKTIKVEAGRMDAFVYRHLTNWHTIHRV